LERKENKGKADKEYIYIYIFIHTRRRALRVAVSAVTLPKTVEKPKISSSGL